MLYIPFAGVITSYSIHYTKLYDKVYAFTPSFTFYKTLAQVQGADFCEIEFPDDYSLPELPDMSDAKLVFFPNPGAPSGMVYSVDEMRKLIEAAPDALVVIDRNNFV